MISSPFLPYTEPDSAQWIHRGGCKAQDDRIDQHHAVSEPINCELVQLASERWMAAFCKGLQ